MRSVPRFDREQFHQDQFAGQGSGNAFSTLAHLRETLRSLQGTRDAQRSSIRWGLPQRHAGVTPWKIRRYPVEISG